MTKTCFTNFCCWAFEDMNYVLPVSKMPLPSLYWQLLGEEEMDGGSL